LKLDDVQLVYLLPPDARLAFEQGKVDAAVFVDPIFAELERTGKARILADGRAGEQRNFYLATRAFAEQHPELIKVFIEQQQQESQWAKNHLPEVAKLVAKDTKVNIATWQWILERRPIFGVESIDEKIIAQQQQIADVFYSLKLLPKRVFVKEAVWSSK
jgi:sulfonate transport system substrate-binding protein